MCEELKKPEQRLLVSLCREMQRNSGGEQFYLSVRIIKDLLGIPKSTASRWLIMFRTVGILELAKCHQYGTNLAYEFLYLGD
jgi:hypothetical protein